MKLVSARYFHSGNGQTGGGLARILARCQFQPKIANEWIEQENIDAPDQILNGGVWAFESMGELYVSAAHSTRPGYISNR